MSIEEVAALDAPAEEELDTIDRFAADLRKLRLGADSPTLARLQSDTGISRTVLSDAFGGRQLPSARTVDSIARACGADASAWVDRRDRLAGQARRVGVAATEQAAGPAVQASGGAATGPASVTRRAAAWIAGGAFAAGVAASALVAVLLVPVLVPMLMPQQPSAAEPAGPQIVVQTGEDPAMTACVDDAHVATGDTRADDSLLEIVWSDKCQAGWGRITRYDGLYQGNTVTIAIYPQTAPDGPDRQDATEHDVQGAYTTLVVRPTPDTLLCAEGSFTVDGERIDLGDPLCI